MSAEANSATHGTGLRVRPGAPLLALSALLLGIALAYNFGNYDPRAIPYLAAALIFSAASALLHVPFAERRERFTVGFLACCLAVELWKIRRSPFRAVADIDFRFYWPLLAGIAAVALLLWAGVSGFRYLERVWFPAVLAVHLCIGAWVLNTQPRPAIDVYFAQVESASKLIAGSNPYSSSYSAGPAYDPMFYGPGIVEHGQVMLGLPYPPLSLYTVLPAHLLGDIRYAHLLAWTLSGILMAFAFPGMIPKLAACLLLFTPKSFYVIEQAWTDSLVIVTFMFTIYLAQKRRDWLWVGLGLMLAMKQYIILSVPLWFLLMPSREEFWRNLWRACALAAILTVPFFIWDSRALWRALVEFQVRQPFRRDSLSFAAAAVRMGLPQMSALIAFALAGAAAILALIRTEKSTAGFASAMALTYFVFFSFNKQAFCNYYAFVIAMLCAACAAAGVYHSVNSQTSSRLISPVPHAHGR